MIYKAHAISTEAGKGHVWITINSCKSVQVTREILTRAAIQSCPFSFQINFHSWPIVPVAGLYREGRCWRLPAGQLGQSYGKCCVSSAELEFGKFLTLERARDRASRVAKSQCPKRRCQSAVSSAGVRVLIVWYLCRELTCRTAGSSKTEHWGLSK